MFQQLLSPLSKKVLQTGTSSIIFYMTLDWTTKLPSEGRSSPFYHQVADRIVTPLLRNLSPEDAHNLAIQSLKYGLGPKHKEIPEKISLKSKLSKDFIFPNCIGLAAGFDKDGIVIHPLTELGFGFIEIGSVTPKPQNGNQKPRLFRLLEDHGIINRMGFNSLGVSKVEKHLQDYRQKYPNDSALLGINIGKNKTTINDIEDYITGIERLGPYADYIVINISSPNTPGLRNLQKLESIRKLLQAILPSKNKIQTDIYKPLFIKIAPDLTFDEMKDIAKAIQEINHIQPNAIDGILVSNTTIQRPSTLLSKHSTQLGGLSGLPLKDLSTESIRTMYQLTNGELFIIGIGGIGSAQDVYDKLKAGASVVQIYSRMIYEGPGVVSRIRNELIQLLKQDSYTSVQDVIGLDHKSNKKSK